MTQLKIKKNIEKIYSKSTQNIEETYQKFIQNTNNNDISYYKKKTNITSKIPLSYRNMLNIIRHKEGFKSFSAILNKIMERQIKKDTDYIKMTEKIFGDSFINKCSGREFVSISTSKMFKDVISKLLSNNLYINRSDFIRMSIKNFLYEWMKSFKFENDNTFRDLNIIENKEKNKKEINPNSYKNIIFIPSEDNGDNGDKKISYKVYAINDDDNRTLMKIGKFIPD